jgi:hypothetical protein
MEAGRIRVAPALGSDGVPGWPDTAPIMAGMGIWLASVAALWPGIGIRPCGAPA